VLLRGHQGESWELAGQGSAHDPKPHLRPCVPSLPDFPPKKSSTWRNPVDSVYSPRSNQEKVLAPLNNLESTLQARYLRTKRSNKTGLELTFPGVNNDCGTGVGGAVFPSTETDAVPVVWRRREDG
jgi:hypothetical protein